MTLGWSSIDPTVNSCFNSLMLKREYFGPGGSHFMA